MFVSSTTILFNLRPHSSEYQKQVDRAGKRTNLAVTRQRVSFLPFRVGIGKRSQQAPRHYKKTLPLPVVIHLLFLPSSKTRTKLHSQYSRKRTIPKRKTRWEPLVDILDSQRVDACQMGMGFTMKCQYRHLLGLLLLQITPSVCPQPLHLCKLRRGPQAQESPLHSLPVRLLRHHSSNRSFTATLPSAARPSVPVQSTSRNWRVRFLPLISSKKVRLRFARESKVYAISSVVRAICTVQRQHMLAR